MKLFSKSFYNYCIFVLITIFLVIIAGSVVRTTQSGMGCPDWPKCFGQYIPPTTMEQVLFAPNKNYTKGQFVKHNDSLWSAKAEFVSSLQFNTSNWKHYDKHGYTKIVIYQTWIEYINRLLGALLGLFIFIQVIWSYRLGESNRSIFWFSLFLLFLTGFQAWLGKTVVDSNLAVFKISLHLAGAVAMLLVQIVILQKLNPKQFPISHKLNKHLSFLGLLVIIQFFLGVIVRQQVDEVAEQFQFSNRNEWLQEVGAIYYVHRSFSLLLFACFLFVWWKYSKYLKNTLFKIIIFSLVSQFSIGILFNYFNFPAVVQPMHLVLSTILIAALFMLLLRKKNNV